jgi:hypothetical protein
LALVWLNHTWLGESLNRKRSEDLRGKGLSHSYA